MPFNPLSEGPFTRFSLQILAFERRTARKGNESTSESGPAGLAAGSCSVAARIHWRGSQTTNTVPTEPMNRTRLHVIACPVFLRELELLAPDAKTETTFQHLDMGLHEGSAATLRAALQAAVDGVAAGQSDAVAIAYGVCNRGVAGLQARALPVVIPRAHDCIGMLLGSSECYLAQLEAQPGTYFQSAGWLEHAPANGEIRRQDLTFGPKANFTREQLAEKYGEDNADYLLEQFRNFTQHYKL